MVDITVPALIADLSLLLIRLVVGFSFIVASRNKSRDIKKFARNNGMPVPVAMLVMITEMLAGLALIFGVFTQIAALAIMLLMIGTMRLHIFKWKSPYWATKGGWEYDLMLFAMASIIFVFGGGKFEVF
ncbi:hypothetical protein A3E49_03405 [Candidatus Saccharibacteria bacterium RIFCSPHIGHO2_12_FULL_49_19]|nr:MAG: hypothetical protein A3E49_03405 [Candidatus Saccharibacteria bacterium RIFCSPHIGHO2_12_FULL_49_19]